MHILRAFKTCNFVSNQYLLSLGGAVPIYRFSFPIYTIIHCNIQYTIQLYVHNPNQVETFHLLSGDSEKGILKNRVPISIAFGIKIFPIGIM